MNWISKLLRKRPGAQTSAASVRPAHAPQAGPRAPLAEDPPAVWVAAICQAPDKALALAWTASLKGDIWLGEVAQQARSAETRYAAARRIETSAVLEQVAHACRDKDKRVYRHCADLLRQRREAEAAARRAREIAAELHGLLAVVPLSSPRLLDLKKQADALGQTGAEACQALLQQAMTRLRQEAETRRELQARQRAAASLAAACEHATWPWSEQIESWRVRLEPLSQARVGMPTWLAGEPAARALSQSLGEIESRLSELALDADRAHACAQFLDELEDRRLPNTVAMTAWEALDKPDDASVRQMLALRWEALRASVPADVSEPVPTPSPRKPAGIDHDSVRGQLDELELAIEQGHLVDADAAMKQIKATWGGNHLDGALEQQLHRLQAKLEALRGWAHWGTGQARDQLIAAARELQNGERGTDELALAIPALREAWKQLNAHGPAVKGQWESFDAALEFAYQPVAALRAEQVARQVEALAAKQALCVEWEAEVADINWEHPDYKAVEARRMQMLKQWRASPHAGFRDERTLRKRFDTLIGSIGQRLDEARAAECERREQVIAAAEALSEQPDLRQAMTQAKALQGNWSQQGVRLKRGDEVKLWQRFRTACDAVFARQDALRAEQTAQRQERVQLRQNLLDAFEAALTGADANGIRQALTRFRGDWEATNSRESVDRLESRAREMQQLAQRRLDELRNEKFRERFDLLVAKATLAERVEAVALAAGPIDAVAAAAKQAWEGLPPLPGKTESLLARRFAAASQITPAELAAGREAREALLLDMEIALGLPSPEAYAAVRRERQLAQLQRRFGDDSAQQSEPEAMLLRWYATAALPDGDFDRRIAVVISQLAVPAASASRVL